MFGAQFKGDMEQHIICLITFLCGVTICAASLYHCIYLGAE